VIPQLLGGNLPELNLNNSGLYYDLYYTTPQESSAVSWLGTQPDVFIDPIQTGFLQEKFYFTDLNEVNGHEAIFDAYPISVKLNSWVILAPPTLNSYHAYAFTPSNGAITEYRYPTDLLGQYKNAVYTNGGAIIYK